MIQVKPAESGTSNPSTCADFLPGVTEPTGWTLGAAGRQPARAGKILLEIMPTQRKGKETGY